MEIGVGCLLIIVGYVLSIPVRGLAISVTWSWFVSPVLHVPEISLIEGVGISFFIAVVIQPLTAYNALHETERTNKTVAEHGFGKAAWDAFGVAVLSPLTWIGLAWLWHMFLSKPISRGSALNLG